MAASQSQPSTLLPNEGYWAGNEPDLLAPWLFAFAGDASRTQYHTRWLVANRYSAFGQRGAGLPGNDDLGTLSSWCVWACLGLYPLTGRDLYVLGSPALDVANVTFGGGELRIVAHDQSPDNVYVRRIELNGVARTEPFVTHAELVAATAGGVGRLEFFMAVAAE